MPGTSLSENVKKWAYQAGIKRKEVTFHVARHTFATLELSLGVDLYTVSKLLGHRSINTTQIYAKVVDKKKEKAIHLIDKSFSK
jgi:site-specific recombinase XerD